MAVEIGSLVVRGTFGDGRRDDSPSNDEIRAEFQRLRREMQREMREMLKEAERRARDR